MANIQSPEKTEAIRKRILFSAAKLFLQKGVAATTFSEISSATGLSRSKVLYEMKSKEEILCELVSYVLEGQFQATAAFLKGKTDDKILFYAAETTLQLYMAESSENVREIYSVAYSMPNSSAIIQQTITGKLEEIFKEHLPNLETKDFYMLEIATGGIMRGFMTVPCNMWFTMDMKVRSFLECVFKLYDVEQEKINEAVEFVSRFDYKAIAENVINNMLTYLENKT
ncbi:MAG: TetR/AcrR family transcriptional regulator [Clostridia bacterium]|nr:TetR/AcrR family transcriptional regulator [Clostridia bacterium]